MSGKTFTEDPDFYVADQLYVFAVETTLFKVHRSVLVQHSEVFKGMFVDGPPSSPNGGDGSSNENPIVLESITAFDFKSFLKIIYKSAEAGFTLSPEEWLAVLCVAHRYECPGIHARALKYLQDGFKLSSWPSEPYHWNPGFFSVPSDPDLSDATRILLAAESRGISAHHFTGGAIRDIVLRKYSLSAAELEVLSSQLAAKLSYARELKLYRVEGATNKMAIAIDEYDEIIMNAVYDPGDDDPHFSLFEPMDQGQEATTT